MPRSKSQDSGLETVLLDSDNAIYPVRVEHMKDKSTVHSTWSPSTSDDPCVIDGVFVELVEAKSSIHADYLLIRVKVRVVCCIYG